MSYQTDQRESPGSTPSMPPWGHLLAITTAIVFFISLAFPVTAGLTRNTATFPKWWGVMDVGIAFILAILAFVVTGLAQGKVSKQAKDASYRTYRILIHGIFVLIGAFFLLGDRINWINGLPGIAWRSWLLLYCLPAWFTVLRSATTPAR